MQQTKDTERGSANTTGASANSATMGADSSAEDDSDDDPETKETHEEVISDIMGNFDIIIYIQIEHLYIEVGEEW